jgi:hypothetical protein
MRNVLWVAALAGCGAPAVVSLHEAMPIAGGPPHGAALEVVTRSTAVRDPLPISGAHAEVSGLEEALGHAVSTAAVEWTRTHPAEAEGRQLTVELTRAQAGSHDGRITVALNVRATLRARVGLRYLAQTQAHCRQATLAPIAEAAPVFYACLTTLGRDLVGWLGGVTP